MISPTMESLTRSLSTFEQRAKLPMIRKDQAYEKENIDAPDKDNELFTPTKSMKYFSNCRTALSAEVINRPNSVRHSSMCDENKAREREDERQQSKRFAHYRFCFCVHVNTNEEKQRDRVHCVSSFRNTFLSY